MRGYTTLPTKAGYNVYVKNSHIADKVGSGINAVLFILMAVIIGIGVVAEGVEAKTPGGVYIAALVPPPPPPLHPLRRAE